jgi:tRNA 2-(methylsulfanyl)-N6-isopentenyladenosine37 hydroxylase
MLEINHILDFLPCKTPRAWIQHALNHIPTLLIDHAHCEKKAASTALSYLYRYPDKTRLLEKMSPIAREELLHFEKVLLILQQNGIDYENMTASRYASELRRIAKSQEPEKLIDTLIIGAIIEARSCERFASLIPVLPEQLARFYASLVKSEARHFEDYINLASHYADCDISSRIQTFLDLEATLINTPDDTFRFHSGVPIM